MLPTLKPPFFEKKVDFSALYVIILIVYFIGSKRDGSFTTNL